MPPQGLVSYAGSQGLLAASFTLAHGVTPSVAALTLAPQPRPLPEHGSLALAYGGVQILFRGCRLESLAAEIDSAGREIWRLAVADRRWVWAFAGRVSGRYNVRRRIGRLVASSERSPRELAALCLAALGEKRFDVSRLPNEPRPEIDWDYTLPAQALARLCDSLGSRVVLRLDDSIALVPAGSGARLPLAPDALEAGLAIEPAPRPAALVLVCGRTRWRRDFRLEAVGLEADGSLAPLEELSYAPRGSSGRGAWRNADVPHFLCVSRPEARGLARQSVFRYYRLAVPFSLSQPNGPPHVVRRLERVLPLPHSLPSAAGATGLGETLLAEPAPRVYGVFHGQGETTRPETERPLPDLARAPRGACPFDFTLDRERGLVIFSRPVFRYFDVGASAAERNLIAPAELYLRAWVSLRDEPGGGWRRHEIERPVSGERASLPRRYIRQDDLTLELREEPGPGGGLLPADNRAAIEAEAQRRLALFERELRRAEPAHVTYAGFKPINLDGAITQVTWSVSPEGFATTRASRNREDATLGPTHQERRRMMRDDS